MGIDLKKYLTPKNIIGWICFLILVFTYKKYGSELAFQIFGVFWVIISMYFIYAGKIPVKFFSNTTNYYLEGANAYIVACALIFLGVYTCLNPITVACVTGFEKLLCP